MSLDFMIRVGYDGNFKFTTSSSFDALVSLYSATRKPQLKVSLTPSAAALDAETKQREQLVSVFMFDDT